MVKHRSSTKSASSSLSSDSQTELAWLAECYRRNGYLRWQNEKRLAHEPYGSYKKGYELRLVAVSGDEYQRIVATLKMLGFKPGAAFSKGRQKRVPIYGRTAVLHFLDLIGEKPVSKKTNIRLDRRPKAKAPSTKAVSG